MRWLISSVCWFALWNNGWKKVLVLFAQKNTMTEDGGVPWLWIIELALTPCSPVIIQQGKVKAELIIHIFLKKTVATVTLSEFACWHCRAQPKFCLTVATYFSVSCQISICVHTITSLGQSCLRVAYLGVSWDGGTDDSSKSINTFYCAVDPVLPSG